MKQTRMLIQITFLLVALASADGQGDLFHYGYNNSNVGGSSSYGQPYWDQVQCTDVDTCPGWPDKFPNPIGWSYGSNNNCMWCPLGGAENCGVHRQSPIDLERNRGILGSPTEKECPDWHWISYKDDTCNWSDMVDQFSIERHALRLTIPTLDNGDIACVDDTGLRQFPRLDYSKGFPDWWLLQRTEITVPAQHQQDGHTYPAEVTLAHFYEVDNPKNEVGHVTIFLQDYEDAESWPFLDKLLCSWRLEEEKTRSECGLDPVEPYGRCSLFRNQEPTEAWLREAGLLTEDVIIAAGEPDVNKTAPIVASSSRPIAAPVTPPFVTPVAAVTAKPVTPPVPPAVLAPTKKTTLIVPPSVSPHEVLPGSPAHRPVTAPSALLPTSKAANVSDTAPVVVMSLPPTSVKPHEVLPGSPTHRPVTAPSVLLPTSKASNVSDTSTLAPVVAMSHPPINGKPHEVLPGSPTHRPVTAPSVLLPTSKTANASDTSTLAPVIAMSLPTSAPEANATSDESSSEIPPQIDCELFPVNYNRMCDSKDPCCEQTRSDTAFCWSIYEKSFPGKAIDSACYHCCPNGPKIVGPPKPEATFPKTVECSDLDSYRVCKDDGCCSNPRSTTSFCVAEYAKWGDDMNSICHYCCAADVELGPSTRRSLLLASNSSDVMPEYGDEMVPEGAKVVYVQGKKYLLRKENFIEDEEDESDYFNRIYSSYKDRSLQQSLAIHDENYEDVEYWPYEWMLKVNTEYYFRYEGTLIHPPCREVVHWRVMKDPIRVHARQIVELNRLLAKRHAPQGSTSSCLSDIAGAISADGNSVKLNRDIQYTHTNHREVFCECKDWPSKFDSDKVWCNGWRNDTEYKRFYEYPYSFESGGKW